MSQGSLFSTRFTLGLAAYLIGAACLAFFTPFEPFPAVFLPGGGDPVPVQNGVARFSSMGLWGRAPGGKKKRIVVSEFLAPIPDYYVFGIARNEFGVARPKPLQFKWGPLAFSVPYPAHSREARREVVAWLKQRLREAGLADDRLFVRREEIEIEMASDRELSRRTKREKTVRLH